MKSFPYTPPGRQYTIMEPGRPVLNVSEIDRFAKDINQAVMKMIQKGPVRGLEEAAEAVKDRAVELAPIETGALRRSAYVRMRSPFLAEVGFGRPGFRWGSKNREPAKYAVYVHELTELHHQPPTQAKFLQQAFQEMSGDVLRIIARRSMA